MHGNHFRWVRSARMRRQAAFSLVEVSIALGIVGFAMVGIVGALPLAMNNGRQSIEQSRAASMSNTIFASFRAQPFTKVCYVDEQFTFSDTGAKPSGGGPAPINLSAANGADSVKFYVTIVEPALGGSGNDPRGMRFHETRQADSNYQVVLRFTNQPDGMLKSGMANRVEATISALGSPKDAYRFTSVIANRQG